MRLAPSMSEPGKTLHLGLWMLTTGHHIAAWRHPASRPEDILHVEFYQTLARIAEAGKFDMVFFEDTLAARERNGEIFGEVSIYSLDPVVSIAALALATERIGLAASYSTTYHAPHDLAAAFAAIDHLSGGRAAWNLVTSGPAAARNFGPAEHPDKETRYARAGEVVKTCKALWEGRGDAVTITPPQGHPVFIQAGMSPWGMDFAAAFAEVIFCAARTLEEGQAFRAAMREKARSHGRAPDSLKTLPGFFPVIGATETEALEKEAYFRELTHPAIQMAMLSERFNLDLSQYPADKPFPMADILPRLEARPNIGGDRARFLADVGETQTIADYCREMAARTYSSHQYKAGSPEQIADHMGHWLTTGGCDGFILMPAQMPGEFQLFVDQVVPELQRRGLFRQDYEGPTLRDHLALARPSIVP
jgi:alkanesulfonate monooxygenase SsuD/methylene tetrahydromethanopterin reductase-like flavin-dependent oxidoreductase (luciferase family)